MTDMVVQIIIMGGHQPSHQYEPGGAVVEGILAVAEDIRALLGASVWAGVVNERLVIQVVRHLALSLVRQLCDVWVGRGEGGWGRAVGQPLFVDAAMEDGGAKGEGRVQGEDREGDGMQGGKQPSEVNNGESYSLAWVDCTVMWKTDLKVKVCHGAQLERDTLVSFGRARR